MAREILAYWDFHHGKTSAALAAYKKLSVDKNAPEGMRQRSLAMATYLGAGGGQDFGTVPQPAPKQLPAPAAPEAGKPAASNPQGPQKK
jgi:hypothetical protein